MAAAIKMDELLVSWLGSDNVYENVLNLIETHRAAAAKAKKEAESGGGGGGGGANAGTSNTNNNTHPLLRSTGATPPGSPSRTNGDKANTTTPGEDDEQKKKDEEGEDGEGSESSPRGVIPPFYRPNTPPTAAAAAADSATAAGIPNKEGPSVGRSRMGGGGKSAFADDQTWDGTHTPFTTPLDDEDGDVITDSPSTPRENTTGDSTPCIREQSIAIWDELSADPPMISPSSTNSLGGADEQDGGGMGGGGAGAGLEPYDRKYLTGEHFVRVTKEVCNFPTFFNGPLYRRILLLWNRRDDDGTGSSNKDQMTDMDVITFEMFRWYWVKEMECYDASERFFRLLKQPDRDFVGRDDFLPYIKELLNDHPGLEFLSNHAEFQEKYAVTVITRIFYSVNKCHSGRITSRQIRRSDLLEAFQQVDEEEDINKVTRYFSYEHFYVLYCRFWELDHDRDYRITREDLLKYGDHSLSHMIVDRIFDAAPRPFEGAAATPTSTGEDGQQSPAPPPQPTNREYLSYEDFIFFMLSEEDKSNEISVRYWFACIDVDGDGRLNNMEMRSFYAVQLHRMQCMGHEIVPFEDMLCQMIDMIKPSNTDYLVVEDFLQAECAQVSGALFDALFNLNKYLQFEQRDPFMERQKREDEFETDWDRFACIDYNRLAMEEEAREEEAMEIDWVTVDDEDDDGDDFNSLGLGGASEAPF